MKDPQKVADRDDPSALDPALREKAKRWFAEARGQTKRDDEEIAAWRRDTGPAGGDGGSGWFDGGGDGGGGGD
ncbi:hypothetical protein [Bosea sp. TAF32]|uniref:hypothetical protein n=1 Tax=Bosea sp. TAF32 TaxID=3237482 RepID=UPI003F8E55C0